MNKCISQIMLGYAVVTNNPQISTIILFFFLYHMSIVVHLHIFFILQLGGQNMPYLKHTFAITEKKE